MSNYTLINWKNGPSGRTKLNANNLNHMDNQIKANSESTEANAEAISQNTEDISKNTAAIEELESKPTSAMLLESASPLEYATNNNIIGLYVEGKSEQYISPNLFNPYIGTMVGLTFTKQSDGGIHIKGTNTSAAFARVSSIVSVSNCVLSHKISGSHSANIYLRIRNSSGTIVSDSSGHDASLTIASSASVGSLTLSAISNGAFTEITLEAGTYDCVIYPMLNSGSTALPYEPYTGTPTPTNPIPIVDASGVVEAHTSNLLDASGLSERTHNGITFTPHYTNGKLDYINVKGTASGSTAYMKIGKIALTNGVVYKYYGSVGSVGAQINNYADNARLTNYSEANPLSFTPNDGGANVYIMVNVGVTVNDAKIYPSIQQGTTAASPYVPYQSNAIAITEAENLIVSNLTSRTVNGITITNNNGVYTLNGTSTGAINEAVNSNFSALDSGRYIFSLCDNSNVVARVVQDISGTRTEHALTPKRAIFDTTNNATYLMQIHINSGVTLNNVIVKPKVEKCIVLRSIPDTNIADTFTVNEDSSGEWVQKVGMRDLEKLNWTFGWSTAWYTDNITDGVAPSIESIANIMSDSYVAKSMSLSPSTSKVGEMGYWASSETKRLACNNGSSTAKPSGILYYELATPIIHTLTKEQVDAIRQLKTYEGTTLIDTELQNVKIKYAGDTKKYVDDKFIYTSEEKLIGEFLGHPLYRKSYKTKTPITPNSIGLIVEDDFSDKKVVNLYGVYGGYSFQMPINRYDTSYTWVEYNGIKMHIAGGHTNYECYVTVEYFYEDYVYNGYIPEEEPQPAPLPFSLSLDDDAVVTMSEEDAE